MDKLIKTLSLASLSLALFGTAALKAETWTYIPSPAGIENTSGWGFSVSDLGGGNLLVLACYKAPSTPGGVLDFTGSFTSGGYTIAQVGNGVNRVFPPDLRGRVQGLAFPNTVTAIGDEAFYGCDNLTSLTLGNGVKSIGNGAFYGCASLASLNLGNSVEDIGSSAFSYCVDLAGTLTLPDSVKRIGNGVFLGCELKEISTPSTDVHFGDIVFAWNTKLEAVYYRGAYPAAVGTGLYDGDNPKAISYIPGAHLTSWNAKAQNGLIESDSAKWQNRPILCLDAPPADWFFSEPGVLARADGWKFAVTDLGGNTFWITDCLDTPSTPSALDLTTLIEGGRSIVSIGAGSALFDSTQQAYLTSLALPATVTNIGNYAFAECASLTGTLSIPTSVRSIGAGAFYNTRPTRIILGAATTAPSLGTDAFYTTHPELKSVYFRGMPPASAASSLYYASGNVTTYVDPLGAILSAWNPIVQTPTIQNGDATWKDRPIRCGSIDETTGEATHSNTTQWLRIDAITVGNEIVLVWDEGQVVLSSYIYSLYVYETLSAPPGWEFRSTDSPNPFAPDTGTAFKVTIPKAAIGNGNTRFFRLRAIGTQTGVMD